jgi:hypothetical protein
MNLYLKAVRLTVLYCLLSTILLVGGTLHAQSNVSPPDSGKVAPKPLYRDPVYDGAADPTVIYNSSDRKWYMFYTVRRANVPGLSGIVWIHATPIGIATSADAGVTWKYLTTAKINYKDAVPDATWWAPAVVLEKGTYHMFLTYVPGIFTDWNHPRDIIHLTSTDLVTWTYISTLPLEHHKDIDPGVLHLPDGTWRLWYKDEADGSSTHEADSPDLYHWTDHGKVPGLSDQGGEAPVACHWKGHYWFFRDIAHGLAMYRSDDAINWSRVGILLDKPGDGPDDKAVGKHPDIILSGDRAYLFYFTHPGTAPSHADVADRRRTSIQVVELKYDPAANILTADRNTPTLINLQPPADPETQSKFN